MVLIGTSRFGPGLSPDSVGYIAAARSILAGHGVRDLDDQPLVVQPPLYPAALSLVAAVTRQDIALLIPWMNALLLTVTIVLSGWLLNSLGSGTTLTLIGALFVLVSKPVFEVSLMAWSEPLFILLTVLWLCLGMQVSEPPGWKQWILFAFVAAAASLTRYLGIASSSPGGLLALMLPATWPRRWSRFVAYGLRSEPPSCRVDPSERPRWRIATGERLPPTSAAENLAIAASRLSSWYVPPGVAALFAVSLVLCVVIVVTVGAWRAGLRQTRFRIVPLFLCSYLALLIAASSTRAVDPIDNRLLAPLYIPLTLYLLYMGSAWFFSCNRSQRWLLVATTTAWLIYSVQSQSRVVRHRAHTGAGGYSSQPWHESALLITGESHLGGRLRSIATSGWLYALRGSRRRVHRWESPGMARGAFS
jgi:hypothetical protein